MPHAPLGILDIPLVTGNDMNMGMPDTLPGRRPYVNTDVIAIRAEFLVQQLALLCYQRHAGVDFFRRQVEKAGHMPFRNHQGMTRAHRVSITRAVRKLVIQ